MDLGLQDSVILVTGASRGLGASIALGLVREGAQVVVAARTESGLADVVKEAGGRASAVAVDLRDEESVRALVPAVLERHGRIDGLVNNAGIAPGAKFLDQDPSVWHETVKVNLLAPMMLAQSAGAAMIAAGGGSILNIASTVGVRGKPYLVGYSASKGAMVRFTEALAAEWASKNVRVNSIAPGAFVTEAQHEVTGSPDLLARRVAKIPAGRMADPEEIVGLACMLLSPLSSFTTGSVVVVDGGESGKL